MPCSLSLSLGEPSLSFRARLAASILTHTGPSGAPTTRDDVRERRDRRSKRCNYIDSSAVAAAVKGERERAKPRPSTNLKTIFDVAAAAAAAAATE